jgi:alanine dehydrogenase
MGAYWDPHAPVLFTNEQMKHKDFKINVIADISCDLNGSVPSTIKTTSFTDPYYDYNPFTGAASMAFSEPANVTVMAIDNLPGGMPREASADFGNQIIKNIMPLLVEGDPEHILERATIAKKGQLTENYRYLLDWVSETNGL